MAFTQITVAGTYKLASGSAASGAVMFTPAVPMQNGPVVVSAPVTGQLDSSGAVSVSLAATTDPGTTPTGNSYEVVEFLNNVPTPRRYNIVVAHNGGQIDLATIAPVVPGPPSNVYLTQAQADARYELVGAGEGPTTPADGTVTNAKVAVGAAIVLDKTADSTGSSGRLAMTNAERTKLSGIATSATANSADATLLARANHTGTQSADTITDGSTNKVLSAANLTKLTGIATAATANSSDATLLARANHTGTQASATISDLTETVQDIVGAEIVAGSNVTATYNDGAGTVTIAAAIPTELSATTQSGSYTLALGDAGTAVETTSASAVAITVPPNSSVAFATGTVIELLQYGAGQITVTPGVGVTIRTAASSTSRTQYSTLSLRKRGTNEWVLAGDLT